MDGISGSLALASSITDLNTAKTASNTQVNVLKKILDQAQQQIVPLLEGLGKNFDSLA